MPKTHPQLTKEQIISNLSTSVLKSSSYFLTCGVCTILTRGFSELNPGPVAREEAAKGFFLEGFTKINGTVICPQCNQSIAEAFKMTMEEAEEAEEAEGKKKEEKKDE